MNPSIKIPERININIYIYITELMKITNLYLEIFLFDFDQKRCESNEFQFQLEDKM